MSNLLPDDAKKEIWSMYRARFTVAGSYIAILAALLCALSLLPSYLALHADAGAGATSSTSSNKATDTDHAAIVAVQSIVASLSPIVAATTSPAAAIAEALSLRPSGITVDHITYSGGDPGTIMLVGSAATREAINGYRQALSADPHFKSVSVPVGDLAGAPGGRFSLTLSGTF